MPEKITTEELHSMRDEVWREIANTVAPDIRAMGGDVQWTVKNLRGWWETPEGFPMDTSDDGLNRWMNGLWDGAGPEMLRQCWPGWWADPAERKAAIRSGPPNYGLGPGMGMPPDPDAESEPG